MAAGMTNFFSSCLAFEKECCSKREGFEVSSIVALGMRQALPQATTVQLAKRQCDLCLLQFYGPSEGTSHDAILTTAQHECPLDSASSRLHSWPWTGIQAT